MSSISNMLLKYLNNLSKNDFERFKSSLTSNWAEGFDPIPRSSLEEATQFNVVDLMVDKYLKSDAIKITVQILKQMGHNKPASDLEQEWEDQMKGGKRSRDEPDQTMDDTKKDCTASLVNMAVKESFLKKHRKTLIKRIRNPIELADELCGKISDEMYANIKSQKTSHAMVREIYLCLNSKTLFNITYDWLKKNESELLEELEKSDPEAEAP